MVQKKLTPFRNPRNSGGSPKGVNDPPILATRKIKKTIVCTLCCRFALARIIGLINNIAAPVVPIQLAKNVPTNISAKLVMGLPTREPVKRTPPEIVNNANRRIMNGMYSNNET